MPDVQGWRCPSRRSSWQSPGAPGCHAQQTDGSTAEDHDDLVGPALAERGDRVHADGQGLDHRTIFERDGVGDGVAQIGGEDVVSREGAVDGGWSGREAHVWAELRVSRVYRRNTTKATAQMCWFLFFLLPPSTPRLSRSTTAARGEKNGDSPHKHRSCRPHRSYTRPPARAPRACPPSAPSTPSRPARAWQLFHSTRGPGTSAALAQSSRSCHAGGNARRSRRSPSSQS